MRARIVRPVFSSALRVAGSRLPSRTHCASAVTRASAGPLVPSQNVSTAAASALPASSVSISVRHHVASAACRSSMIRNIAPCAFARMTSGGVSSVSPASIAGSAARRAASAHPANVITGTPSTSSDGNTRDTYAASARW